MLCCSPSILTLSIVYRYLTDPIFTTANPCFEWPGYSWSRCIINTNTHFLAFVCTLHIYNISVIDSHRMVANVFVRALCTDDIDIDRNSLTKTADSRWSTNTYIDTTKCGRYVCFVRVLDKHACIRFAYIFSVKLTTNLRIFGFSSALKLSIFIVNGESLLVWRKSFWQTQTAWILNDNGWEGNDK